MEEEGLGCGASMHLNLTAAAKFPASLASLWDTRPPRVRCRTCFDGLFWGQQAKRPTLVKAVEGPPFCADTSGCAEQNRQEAKGCAATHGAS